MRSPLSLRAIALIAGLVVVPSVASAVEPEFIVDGVASSEPTGWTGSADISASFSLTQNDAVVGQPDGTSMNLAGNLAARLDYASGQHEVRNSLTISETFAKTPVIPEFVKSSDTLRFESIYFYSIPAVPWVGPFARFQLDTTVFSGFDVRAGDTTYLITWDDGEQRIYTNDRLRLTDPFSPLFLKESTGGFVRPFTRPWLDTDVRVGAGSRQVVSSGELVVSDDADTADFVEVREITSYNQAGVEAAVAARGETQGGRITYGLSAEALFPLYNSVDQGDRSVLEQTDIEVAATASFKIVDWASLDYKFQALRLPAVVDEWQVSNMVLFTVSTRIFELKPAAAEAPAAE